MTARRLRYLVEGGGFWLLMRLFRLMPLDRASALGGRFGRLFGPRSGLTRIARDNLRRAFPEFDAAQVEDIIDRMWDNLGRTLAEYPHLGRFYPEGRVEIVGAEHVTRLRDDGQGGIFFSAHYGNWELLSLSLDEYGVPPVLVYRPANNPYSEKLIQDMRMQARRIGGVEYIPKAVEGARQMVKALRAGKHLAMLVDQKLNRGIPVPFFGRDAMTAPAIAQLALKYRVPVVPARIERLDGARFRLTFWPPLDLPRTGDLEADVAAAMRQIHALFEAWISERPDHWFWVHNRWPRDRSA